MTNRQTIADIIKAPSTEATGPGVPRVVPVDAYFYAQITALEQRTTTDGKPYLEVTFADGTAEMAKIRVWENAAAFPGLSSREKGDFVAIRGSFTHGKFGWESRDFVTETLAEEEVDALLGGTDERRAFLEARWNQLGELVSSMACRFLRELTVVLLNRYEKLYRRAAAARGNHHARRGGLVEHVTEMAQMADAQARIFPELNRSLLIAGVVWHDVGKIFENQYLERGFEMPFDVRAELHGHIMIGWGMAEKMGMEVLQTLKLTQDANARHALDCLRHMIASHHGELAFGSPVPPKFVEAMFLHYIDQMSAKREMMRDAFAQKELAPGLHEKKWPLNVSVVEPALEHAQ